MLVSIAIILLCQLMGEFISNLFSVPIPGPVIGMVLIMIYLALRERFKPMDKEKTHYSLEKTGHSLLMLLPLMFVPITVGIMDKISVFREHGVAIFSSVMLSTILTLAISAWIFLLIAKWTKNEEDNT